jgi:hypothetical protein
VWPGCRSSAVDIKSDGSALAHRSECRVNGSGASGRQQSLAETRPCSAERMRRWQVPAVGQVQVDPGRLVRPVPGLGLHRHQRHGGFPQPGQAGAAKLVTGQRDTGSVTRAADDLVQPGCRERLPAPRILQDKEPSWCRWRDVHDGGNRQGW